MRQLAGKKRADSAASSGYSVSLEVITNANVGSGYRVSLGTITITRENNGLEWVLSFSMDQVPEYIL